MIRLRACTIMQCYHLFVSASTLCAAFFCAFVIISPVVRRPSDASEHPSQPPRRRLRLTLTHADLTRTSASTAAWVTERLPMSTLRRNWIPVFGGNSSSAPSATDPPSEWPGDDSVPLDVAECRIVKQGPKLPYRMYNQFDLGGSLGRMSERKVISLKNDVAEVRIDPKHGGKILSYKVRGEEQLFRNPIFQPGMLGILGAWTSGGIEFNWPIHGHSSFTAAPVFLATFKSKRLGTVVRIYEFDRVLNSTWQVDIALVGEKLAMHPRVVNTNSHRIDGYWWTNIGSKLTESTRVFYNDAPYVMRNGGPKGDYLAPFPMLLDDKSGGVSIEGNTSILATDHSFPVNNYKATEMFVRPDNEGNKTLWMASLESGGNGWVHTQPPSVRGRKYWVWGNDPADVGRMNFLSRCAVKDGQPSIEQCEGSYLELQAGPAPTQSNFFPLEKEQSWTEIMVPLRDVKETHTPGADGYSHALDKIDSILTAQKGDLQTIEDELSGVEGLGPAALDSWLLLHAGSGFGQVHEKLTGHALCDSLSFSDDSDADARPWLHLVESGNFSTEDLDVVAPTSFMVDWPYIRLLRETNESWLQQLHLGIALRQQGLPDAAETALERSVELRPKLNPLGLSLLGRHGEAWAQVSEYLRSDAYSGLAIDIAEAWVTSLLTSFGIKEGLQDALLQIMESKVDSQHIRSARISLLIYGPSSASARAGQCKDALHLLQTTEWAVSNSILTRLWRDAWYCIEEARTSTEKHHSRVAHPPPRYIDFNGAT
eukprot:TRINITY_DN62890_c0_g1_i1.p1 TRINITY_DN62890_c0_g1~~TRINITY_DN62890_c0_g1_i1.p1  ORF type:complete len:766 (-),score=78.10 TRINITY_DN62890_c0_g1_i1:127-2424(-)